MPTPDPSPWLDIPTRLLLTMGERDVTRDERRLLTSGTPTRLLPRDTASRVSSTARRPLRRRNNGLA